jgi:hypothetical protein
MFSAVKQLAKGTELIAHQMTLLRDEVYMLRQANIALSKRRKAKRTRIQARGALSVEHALELIEQKDAIRLQQGQRVVEEGGERTGRLGLRRCKRCSKTGHNVRTCQEAEDTSDEGSTIECS